MTYKTQHITTGSPWHHLYATTLDAVESVVSDASAHCIGTPLPLSFQIKAFKIQQAIHQLEALDPRNPCTSFMPALPVAKSVENSGPFESLPFQIGNKVYCRHLRTTGEIKGIAFHADRQPEAHLLSLHHGKLTWVWVSMNDLESPLAKRDCSFTDEQRHEPEAARRSFGDLPLLQPSPQPVA